MAVYPASSDIALAVNEVIHRAQERAKSPGEVWGLDTGFRGINRLTGGLHEGMTILGAFTSHGKTALATQITTNVADQILREWESMDPKPAMPPGLVVLVSPEMTTQALVRRYATQESRVPVQKIKQGTASPEELEQWCECASWFIGLAPVLRVYTGSNTSYKDIIENIDMLHEMAVRGDGPPLRLVVIDYIQRLSYGDIGGGTGNDYQTLSAMANGFQALAKELRIPVLVAAQLRQDLEKDRISKQGERPPELTDLQGSGVLMQAADAVWLLWRPNEAQKVNPLSPQRAKLYIKKDRDGQLGETELLFWPHLVCFGDPDYLRGDA